MAGKTTRSRIDDVLDRQRADLVALDDAAAARMLEVYEDARRRLLEEMLTREVPGRAETFSIQHMRVMRMQLERGIQLLRDRLVGSLSETTTALQRRAWQDLLDVIKAAEPDFRDTGNRIESRVISRLSENEGLLLHRYSVERYTADVMAQIQRELAAGLAMGKTPRQVRESIVGKTSSVLAKQRGRADLIVRMELNSAYNKHHQAALEEAAEFIDGPDAANVDDPLLRKADEYADLRNNPISRALDEMVTRIDEPWRVPRAKVEAVLQQLNAARAARDLPPRRLSGIVWPLEGGHYVGMTHPAHFHDRGRQVPWRESWGPDRPGTSNRP